MKKKMTNKLDEMQEQKMLRIESNGCWIAFWGLLAVLFIQVIVYGYEGYGDDSWRYMAGEWIVFMCQAQKNTPFSHHIFPTIVSVSIYNHLYKEYRKQSPKC